MLTLKNADQALKDYYLNAVAVELSNASPFFSAIEKSAENVSGKNASMAIVAKGAKSIAVTDEDGDLPRPYSNRYYNVSVPLKNIYGTIEISDKMIRASRNSEGAFVNVLNAEMQGLIECAKDSFARMLFSDGSGKIATLGEKVEPFVYKIDNLKNIEEGMSVALSNGNLICYYDVPIVGVDAENSTVTLEMKSDFSVDGMDVVDPVTYKKEVIGLGGLFNDASLYGFEKYNEPYFQGYKVELNSTPTEEQILEVIDHLAESADSQVDMILCSYSMRRKIAKMISSGKTIVNSIDVHAGLGGIYVNGIPVIAEKYCPENEVYFINTKDFVLAQLCDWEWIEDEDGKILKQVAGKAAYSATLVKYAELICKKPCGQGMIVVKG